MPCSITFRGTECPRTSRELQVEPPVEGTNQSTMGSSQNHHGLWSGEEHCAAVNGNGSAHRCVIDVQQRAAFFFITARDGRIPNQGQQSLRITTNESRLGKTCCQIGEVNRPLTSITQTCDAGNEVTFIGRGLYLQLDRWQGHSLRTPQQHL